MACSVYRVLTRHGRVDQDALAASFAEHHDCNRNYGMSVGRVLHQVRDGAPWRRLAHEMFGGQGSYGNGGAMRVAPLGAWFADDPTWAAQEAALSAQVTHTHPEGVAGAVAVAVAAALAASPTPPGSAVEFLDAVLRHTPPGQVHQGVRAALDLVGHPGERHVAAVLGTGREVSAQDTVPLALWIAARHLGSFEEAVWAAVRLAEDVDTVAAIVGGVVAARVGPAGLPESWLQACEPPPPWACGLGGA